MPDPSSTPTTTPTTTTQPSDVTNIELVQWVLGRLNAKDVDSLRRFWTATSIEYFPTGTYQGTDAIADYFGQLFTALPDFHIESVSIAESGDDVLLHWHVTGHHAGTFAGVDGTGRRVDFEGFDHFVIRDGTLITNTVRYDQMEFARQIKMLPSDGSIADRAMKAAFNAKTRVINRVRR